MKIARKTRHFARTNLFSTFFHQPASARLANTKHMENKNQSSPVPGIKGSQEFFKPPKQMPNGLPNSNQTQ